METVGVEPTSASLQARCSVRLSYIPQCGRVESNHHSPRRQGYSLLELAGAQRRVRRAKGGRPGSNRRRRGSQPRVLPSTPRPPRAGTTGFEPAASRLTSERSCPSELRPRMEVGRPARRPASLASSAGGIRTHGLELMRLARTASPLRRKSGWQESNLRSPVPETGGVARSPTAR